MVVVAGCLSEMNGLNRCDSTCHPCIQQSCLPGVGIALELSAGKSGLGHAETAAGAVGIARVVQRLTTHVRPEILHLRALNSYVTGIMESVAGGEAESIGQIRSGCTVPRQGAPGLTGLPVWSDDGVAWTRAFGVSGFGFQGSNAHVTLASTQLSSICDAPLTPVRLNGARAGTFGVSTDPVWQRRRFWYAPPPHALLRQAISWTTADASIVFGLQLQQPRLAYLWDHQVWQRPHHVLAQLCICREMCDTVVYYSTAGKNLFFLKMQLPRLAAACWLCATGER